MNPSATSQKKYHVLRDTASASTWTFAPWMTLATTETTALVEVETARQCFTASAPDDESHFVFLASSAFEADAFDAAEGGCPTPRLCATNGCRGLCLPPSAA